MLVNNMMITAQFLVAILMSSIVFATLSSRSKSDFKRLFYFYSKKTSQISVSLISIVLLISFYAT